MNDEDHEAWYAELATVVPLNPLDHVPVTARGAVVDEVSLKTRRAAAITKTTESTTLTLAWVEPCDPDAVLGYKRDGVQEGVYKKLRLGLYPCRGLLDLHHQTLAQASLSVYQFIEQHYCAGNRMVRIVHGRGLRSASEPALLKRYCAHWLKSLPSVLAYHSAKACDGGTGALYVLLRKNPDYLTKNGERLGLRK